MRVTGIGGYFLRAQDPDALAAWYRRALGVDFSSNGAYAVFPGDADASSVFALFGPADPYVGEPARQRAMVNLRVDSLDEVVANLTAMGEITEPVLDEAHGRFSWIVDPDGNRVELWEPPKDA